MKVYIYVDEQISASAKRTLISTSEKDLVIVASREVERWSVDNLSARVEFLDIVFAANEDEVRQAFGLLRDKIDYGFMEYAPELNSTIRLSTYNQSYRKLSFIINSLLGIRRILAETKPVKIVLMGGSSCVYPSITMAEYERNRIFLYKRSWFLNKYIYSYFCETYDIEWRKGEHAVFLSCLSNIRLFLITFIKKRMRIKHLSSRPSEGKDNHDYDAIVSIRAMSQQVAAKSLYDALVKSGRTPIVVVQPNYNNSDLLTDFCFNEEEYINLNSLIEKSDVVSSYRRASDKRKNLLKAHLNVDVQISGGKFKFNVSKLLEELSDAWGDYFIREIALARLREKFEFADDCFWVNFETFGAFGCIDSDWCAKNEYKMFGFQHVVFAKSYLPIMSWNDVYFAMNEDDCHMLSDYHPEDAFEYLGPVVYDEIYNSKRKTTRFTVSIFTQPDDFQADFDAVIPAVVSSMRELDIDGRLIIKVHPRDIIRDAMIRAKSDFGAEIIENQLDSTQVIQESDLVISVTSGTLIQSVLIGPLTVSMNMLGRNVDNLDFLKNPAILSVTTIADLRVVLGNFENLAQNYEVMRMKGIQQLFPGYAGKAAEKAVGRMIEESGF